jgi:hypothetical protein
VQYLEELEQVVKDALPRATKRVERASALPHGWVPAAD